jgi:SMC interacting uncharacterized protein involved in chromosome segregation
VYFKNQLKAIGGGNWPIAGVMGEWMVFPETKIPPVCAGRIFV